MGKTVVGFFKDVSDVQKAIRQLEDNGISNQHVDVSRGMHEDGHARKDGTHTNKFTEFFNKLFGRDSDDARLYSNISQQDVHILTVHASSGEMAEIAADILDDCGALDVDERVTRASQQDTERRSNSSSTVRDEDQNKNSDVPNLQKDISRSPRNTFAGEDKSLSYRDDYANTLSTENFSSAVNEPTNLNDDRAGQQGPASYGTNSSYVDERSYPGDRRSSQVVNDPNRSDTDNTMQNPIEREAGLRNRPLGNMGAASNDDYSRSGIRQAGYNNESGTRAQGSSFTGHDMTNDGISSPDDDQRTINQNNPQNERRNMVSDEESTGLETRIPSPQEQLYRARRRSRIINASIDDNYRLRD
ncbi:MAG TPA: hypothetical protein VLC28_15925 [Flavitalea sp.]|nr:hypothetical protein [Flavitalea sp.]